MINELFLRSLNWVEQLGPWGPAGYVLFYVLATILFIPTALLAAAAGALFGVTLGLPLVSTASLISAAASFLVGRHLSRPWFRKTFGGHHQLNKMRAIGHAVGKKGTTLVVLLRVAAIFPFTALNYALGLSRITLKNYLVATWVAMLPGLLLQVYAGSLVRNLAELTWRRASPLEWILLFFGFAAAIVAGVYAAHTVKKTISIP